MKRLLLVVPVFLLLAGCAQVFEGNLFTSVDKAPPINVGSLKSSADVKAQIADPAAAQVFYQQLKSDPAALTSVQTTLSTEFSTTAITAATTADQKQAVVDAAQTYITVTAFGSGAAAVATQAITQATNLLSGGTPEAAVQNLLAGKSQTEIATLLTQFTDMNGALTAMQTVATTGTTVDSTTFFGSTTNKGDLAQVALVAAAASALVADATGATTADKVAALAATLASGGTPAAGTNLTHVQDALSGTSVNPGSNPYAYLSAVTGIVKL